MAETRNWNLPALTDAQVGTFCNHILSSAASMQLAGQAQITVNDVTITHLVFEQYFMRNSSYACLSVELVRTAQQTSLSAISAGGSQGLLNFDWGSADNMLNKVEQALQSL